jgi:DNA repair protein RadC
MNPKRRRLDFGVCQIRVMRVNEAPPRSYPAPTLDSPERIYDFWREHIATAAWFSPDQEFLTTILLNIRFAVVGWSLVSIGTLTESIVHPREVPRPAVAANAYAFALAHNHPSGVTPYAVLRRTERGVPSDEALLGTA